MGDVTPLKTCTLFLQGPYTDSDKNSSRGLEVRRVRKWTVYQGHTDVGVP